MEKKTCMVIGHRDLPPEKVDYIRERLEEEVLQAIVEGYRHFISGFAEGAELLFADVVAQRKACCPISLEAAIPYRNRIHSKDRAFQHLLALCDRVSVHSEAYSPNCWFKNGIAVSYKLLSV